MSKAAELAALIGSQTALSNRNLIINGAMQVAQRGTSSSTNNYQSVDRWKMYGSESTTTKSQQTLTSGSPYDEGFRYFARQANTSVSSSTTAYVYFAQWIEAQNVAGSGWNYTSTSSSVTLSFWARSSLAGTYYAGLTTNDGTEYIRHKAFTLAADTWTKVTFTTAGNSNLTFNTDSGQGLFVEIVAHYGTAYTGGEEVNANDWYTRGGNLDAYYPNFAQNWGNTASATFDVTGVQLETGEQSTPFEHSRSYGETLAKCQRYYQQQGRDGTGGRLFGVQNNTNYGILGIDFPQTMRAAPTLTLYGGNSTSGNTFVGGATGNNSTFAVSSTNSVTIQPSLLHFNWNNILASGNASHPFWIDMGLSGSLFSYTLDAEL